MPPAAMKPNSLRPCALLKQSARTLQKTLTTYGLGQPYWRPGVTDASP